MGTGLPRAGLTSWSYKVIMAYLRSGQTVTLPSGGPDRDSQVIWANVTHKCLTNKQKDIAWMTAHRCLPTRTFMYCRHLALTDHCPHGCTDSEHILYIIQKYVRVKKNISKYRKEVVASSRLRLGHTRLNSTLIIIIKKTQTDKCDVCKCKETVEHVLLSCRKFGVKRERLKGRMIELGRNM